MAPKHRMSSLPIAQFCPQGPRLSSVSSGRAAAQSSAFHASCAGDPNAAAMIARLTEQEAAELMTWKRPTPLVLENGVILKYEDAQKEVAVALDANGNYCDPESPEAITVGHLDFAWVVDGVAYVGDLKRSEYTSEPDSLQLLAYLVAWADKHGCEQGCAGIWDLTGGQWSFGGMVDLGMFSEQRAKLIERIVVAATHEGDGYNQGAHCTGCYGRSHCPSYLLPPELADSSLAPFTKPGALEQLSPTEIGTFMLMCKRAEDTIDLAKAAIRDFVSKGGSCELDGKLYRPVKCKGRVSLDSAALTDDLPEIAQKYTRVGKSYDQWKWVKP